MDSYEVVQGLVPAWNKHSLTAYRILSTARISTLMMCGQGVWVSVYRACIAGLRCFVGFELSSKCLSTRNRRRPRRLGHLMLWYTPTRRRRSCRPSWRKGRCRIASHMATHSLRVKMMLCARARRKREYDTLLPVLRRRFRDPLAIPPAGKGRRRIIRGIQNIKSLR